MRRDEEAEADSELTCQIQSLWKSGNAWFQLQATARAHIRRFSIIHCGLFSFFFFELISLFSTMSIYICYVFAIKLPCQAHAPPIPISPRCYALLRSVHVPWASGVLNTNFVLRVQPHVKCLKVTRMILKRATLRVWFSDIVLVLRFDNISPRHRRRRQPRDRPAISRRLQLW